MNNILVVCHGNRFRSPFAAGLIAKLRPDLTVRSSGVKLPVGVFPAARAARAAALLRGVDLNGHRAQQTTVAMVEWADIVLYMDGGNLRRLRDQFPGLNTHKCLASYVGKTRIQDPNFVPNHLKEPIWQLLEAACIAFCKKQ